MTRGYRLAVAVAALALGSILWGLLAPSQPQLFAFGALALPVAVLLAVKERVGENPSLTAGVAGTAIGVGVAILSHGVVFGFAYLFFFGFADQAVDVLEALRLDPQLSSSFGSPWAILLMVEYVVVAPITEELGKSWGGVLSRPDNRRQAFLAGVTAGTGFAIAENLAYAAFTGVPWNEILLARSLGAAVHPLATGLVMLGWWEWRKQGGGVKTMLAGAGIHALWNGSLVVLVVTESAMIASQAGETFAQMSLAYSAAIGAALAAGLWRVAVAVAEERPQLAAFEWRRAADLGAWTVLTASFLVPVAMLLLAFPALSSERELAIDDLTTGWEVIEYPEPEPVPDAGSSGFMSIVATDTELLVVGAEPINAFYEGIWRSPDARTWTQIETTGLPEDTWISLEAWWQGTLVALADGEIWLSSDGAAWARTADPTGALLGQPVFQVVPGGPGLAAISVNDIWVSDDGETWQVAVDEDFSNPLGTLASNPQGQLLAIREDGLTTWSSTDGISWTRTELAVPLPTSYGDLRGLIGTETGWAFISGAENNVDESPQPTAWWSEDGTSWQQVAVNAKTPSAFVLATTAFPGGMVAVGVPGIWVSSDGQVWTPASSPTVDFAWATDVTVWQGSIVAVGFAEGPLVWTRSG